MKMQLEKEKTIKIVKDPEYCFILWSLLGKNKRLPWL